MLIVNCGKGYSIKRAMNAQVTSQAASQLEIAC